ncbi:hypothetical protein A2Z67_02255 [Candidatus Woesebacteria bacterium RBG_13_36_22]|uniref:Uncharacterized protein n=1 Tax=Candidatus Woesebacteria bacterium RBG_13_36_22 TaxID=1802478 RepID=A0A1F7X155_9BACT|nr:MAG: hypothetical protein A2Z67_02255 [Candidatus Woesebacteria bacterium RBG_13_36_22]
MKKILRYIWMDKPSMIFLLFTIGLIICSYVFNFNVRFYLVIVVIFVFRGMMWQGQYKDKIDSLEKFIQNYL